MLRWQSQPLGAEDKLTWQHQLCFLKGIAKQDLNLSLTDGKPYWWAIAVCGILFVRNAVFLIYVFGRR